MTSHDQRSRPSRNTVAEHYPLTGNELVGAPQCPLWEVLNGPKLAACLLALRAEKDNHLRRSRANGRNCRATIGKYADHRALFPCPRTGPDAPGALREARSRRSRQWQHPQTANGVIFASLEDETGINNHRVARHLRRVPPPDLQTTLILVKPNNSRIETMFCTSLPDASRI